MKHLLPLSSSLVISAIAAGSLALMAPQAVSQGPVYEALLKKDPAVAEEYRALRAQMEAPPRAANAPARPPTIKASPVVDHAGNLVELSRLRSGDPNDPTAVAAAAHGIDQHLTSMKGKTMADALALWDHLYHCEVCGPIILSALKAHTDAVASLPHALVLFAYDSEAVPEANVGANGPIRHFAQQLDEEADLKLMLIGRASRLGDLEYNRKLSHRRAQAVREIFEDRFGLGYERVLELSLGWEPPQLDSVLAKKYGLGNYFDQVGQLQINQSVLMVLYRDDPSQIDGQD